MKFYEYIRKKKVLATMVVVALVLAATALLAWRSRKNTDDAAEVSVESKTEQASMQETEQAEGAVSEPQEESSGESEVNGEQEATEEPKAVEEAEVTKEATLTEEYELLCEGVNIFKSVGAETYIKYEDAAADLYMRRLRDDTGEYVELSLWLEQKEIWHTVEAEFAQSDYMEYYHLFWQKKSEHLALNQNMCYYVVPIDGTVYLMKYCVETASNAVTMSYKVFGISADIDSPNYYMGHEAPLDADSISFYLVSDGGVNTEAAFPVERMLAFADTVKGYMEKGCPAASALQGSFEFGASADKNNPIEPYLYDIFPWIPEMIERYSVNTEELHSANQLLAALSEVLPIDAELDMPDVSADGACFITGDYYSDSDESYLTVRMKEDGSYEGHFMIDNALNVDFAGAYDDGILTAVETDNYPDETPYKMEISFRDGKATVTITDAFEYGIVKVGEVLTLDRNEKPKEMDYKWII